MLSLGIDIGTSTVKVAILDLESGATVATGSYPEGEMDILAVQPGWAEQDPGMWWDAFLKAYSLAAGASKIDTRRIQAIGIAYQMHGLVCLDKSGKPPRPSIIWCDSRAVEIGGKALEGIGRHYAFNNLLNGPGNFTASKLKWVMDNEPEVFDAVEYICLPGDYIGYRLTGILDTTLTGASEGVFYDFRENEVSQKLMEYFGFDQGILPHIRQSFANHGAVRRDVAAQLGIARNAMVSYKAGDQPNNAFSLNVMRPGEVAATAGTSGVVYGITDELFADPSQRVNSFAHVNHAANTPRIGVLLCINGAGSAYAWARKWTSATSYETMNAQAGQVQTGCDGLMCFPFGNGAERMLGNTAIGATLAGANFLRHSQGHIYRAVQEGIAYAFRFGLDAFSEADIDLSVIRAGHANLFQSAIFGDVLSTLAGIPIELYNTDGAIGAARGALIGAGYADEKTAFASLGKMHVFEPQKNLEDKYLDLYADWKQALLRQLGQH